MIPQETVTTNDDPLSNLILAVLTESCRQLESPTSFDHKCSRRIGFVNAEHDVLVFIASPLFFMMVEHMLGGGVERIGQGILDKAYGEGMMQMCTEQELRDAPEIVRRHPNNAPERYQRMTQFQEVSIVKPHIFDSIRAYNAIVYTLRAEAYKERVACTDTRSLILQNSAASLAPA